MSVVATYVRLSPEQLELAAAEDPKVVLDLGREGNDPAYQGTETLYFDKGYRSIAWLLSPLARAEDDHLARLIESPDELEAARARVAAIGAMHVDPAFEALYGDRSHVDERFDIGLDPPAVMSWEKVRTLSAVLDGISSADLEGRLDRGEMIRVGMNYADEDDLMDDYILPNFERLQAFYREAAAQGQVVMVVFS